MDVRSTILNLFPKARITSGYRAPNSALGRANPRSYHNVGRAFDVAPIPGVGFDDYVAKLKGAGVNIVEALDEQKHPLPHTTGPNWHIAFGDAKPMPPRKPTPVFAAMSQVMGGYDPLAPLQPPMTTPPIASPQPNLAAMSQPVAGMDPLAPQKHKKGSLAGLILGALGDAALGYVGRPGIYAQSMMDQAHEDREDDRFRQHLAAQSELARQRAIWDAQQPTDLMQRVRDLNGLQQGLGDTYAKNYASNGGGLGIKLFTDPATGQTYNIGESGGGPQTQVIDGTTYYNVNGKWYDNPEGR